jgi:hypothetical protein
MQDAIEYGLAEACANYEPRSTGILFMEKSFEKLSSLFGSDHEASLFIAYLFGFLLETKKVALTYDGGSEPVEIETKSVEAEENIITAWDLHIEVIA